MNATKEISAIIFENDLNALLPTDYISNETERFNIYKRLYNSMSESDLSEIRNELSDRFGQIPHETENLFKVVKLKLCFQIQERLQLKNYILRFYVSTL